MIADTLCSSGSPVVCEFTACLDRARSGDQQAARELVTRVEPMVYRIIRAHLPRRDVPEDIAQEVFMKMFARMDQYRGSSSFRRWLSQITLRTCYDHLRAQRCRPELRHADLSVDEAAALEVRPVEDHRRESRELLATRELLQLLLERLSPDDRKVVVLFNLEQKSIAEIAALTRWSRDLVKMRVFRARKKMRRMLAEFSPWDGPRKAGWSRSLGIPPSPRRKPAKKFTAVVTPFSHPRAA